MAELEIGNRKHINVLFATWDGPQVTYLEGLFLPIFVKLAEFDLRFHILQFTWAGEDRIGANRLACHKAGVPYRTVKVWRYPRTLGALVTALMGSLSLRRTVNELDIDIVMARSTLPALSAMLAVQRDSVRMVFDADGLPLDERVDFNGWAATSLVYRLLRDVEAQAVRTGDVVITRSQAACRILRDRAGAGTKKKKFVVVQNGRDSEVFAPGNEETRTSLRKRHAIPLDAPLVAYAGSVGTQYCVDQMFEFVSVLLHQRPDAHFLFLTGAPELATKHLDAHRSVKAATTIRRVSCDEVPAYLCAADVGLAFRRPSFSMQAVAPIKLGEYLLCGLPVVASAGIGDTSSVVKDDIGFLVNDVESRFELNEATKWLLNVVLPARDIFRHRCRKIGVSRFSLSGAVDRYRHALELCMDKKACG